MSDSEPSLEPIVTFDPHLPDRAEYVILAQLSDEELLEGIAAMNEQFRGADGVATAKQLRAIIERLRVS